MRKKFLYICIFLLFHSSVFSLTLSESIKIALMENPDIKVAEYELKRASIRYTDCKTDFLPRIYAETDLGKEYFQPYPFEMKIAEMKYKYTLGFDEPSLFSNYRFSISQPIFAKGSLRTNLKLAKYEKTIKELNLINIKNEVECETGVTFLEILKARKTSEITEIEIRILNLKYEKLNEMAKLDMIPKMKINEVELNLDMKKNELKRISSQLEYLYTKLNKLLNRKIDEVIEIDEKIEATELPDLNEILNKIEISPKVLLSCYETSMKGLIFTTRYYEFLPSLSLIASYNIQKKEYPDTKYDTTNWSLFLELNWNITDALFKTSLHIKSDETELMKQKLEENNLTKELELQVRNIYEELKLKESILKTLLKNIELTNKKLQETEEKYKLGMSDIVELETAKLEVQKAKIEYNIAQYDYLILRYKLQRLIG